MIRLKDIIGEIRIEPTIGDGEESVINELGSLLYTLVPEMREDWVYVGTIRQKIHTFLKENPDAHLSKMYVKWLTNKGYKQPPSWRDKSYLITSYTDRFLRWMLKLEARNIIKKKVEHWYDKNTYAYPGEVPSVMKHYKRYFKF